MNPKATAKLAHAYPCWPALEKHRESWQQQSLQQLFDRDPSRGTNYALEAAGLYLDYSKNHLNRETLALFEQLAKEAGLADAIQALVNGKQVNNTEQRPALHSALRHQGAPGTKEEKAVNQCLAQMTNFVDTIHSGRWTGFDGNPVADIVNIGIGGSDLGPRMVTDALTPFHQHKTRVHFVSNIDGAAINDIFQRVKPNSTLFIIASKSFSTLETIENARTARQWMIDNSCSETDISRHFVAVTARADRAADFGIAKENIFPLWDWVGGRYSLWSAIGLPIALALGMEHFNALRAGATEMDNHFTLPFTTRPATANLPALMALITFWYSQLWQAHSQAVLPYNHHMNEFPEFLQQLDMESLGKAVTRDGQPTGYQTGLVIWGAEGSNGQHSFHQLLHQGSYFVPVDFIATLTSRHNYQNQHQKLFACCVSQSQALMRGKTLQEAYEETLAQGYSEEEATILAPHKVIPGNRPSNTLLIDCLTPRSLGALIALYEHKVYCLSVLLRVNAFDQWGVELGKELGMRIDRALSDRSIDPAWDSSTRELLRRFQKE